MGDEVQRKGRGERKMCGGCERKRNKERRGGREMTSDNKARGKNTKESGSEGDKETERR